MKVDASRWAMRTVGPSTGGGQGRGPRRVGSEEFLGGSRFPRTRSLPGDMSVAGSTRLRPISTDTPLWLTPLSPAALSLRRSVDAHVDGVPAGRAVGHRRPALLWLRHALAVGRAHSQDVLAG